MASVHSNVFRNMLDSGVPDDTPVWIVAVKGVDLDNSMIGVWTTDPDNPDFPIKPVEGGFFVWEASSGVLLAEGSLNFDGGDPDWDTYYSDIAALANEDLHIGTATQIP